MPAKLSIHAANCIGHAQLVRDLELALEAATKMLDALEADEKGCMEEAAGPPIITMTIGKTKIVRDPR